MCADERPEVHLQKALDELAAGRREAAAKKAQSAVERWPKNPSAWLVKGVIADARGQVDNAKKALERALKLNPNDPQALNSYGVVAIRQGRLADATDAFEKALSIAPDYPQALNNLGNVKRGKGAHEEAAELYRKALALMPNYQDAQVNLSIVLSKLGQAEASEACARRAWELGVTEASAFQLGVVLKAKGDREGAITALRAALERDPSDGRGAALLLSALGAAPPPPRPSSAYVRSLFDGISEGYDQHLETDLEYTGPTVIAAALDEVLGEPAGAGLTVLDLGCGTGLLAPAIAERTARIDGVDLSPGMVEQARARSTYTELAVGDIVEYMAAAPEDRYDAVIAADVLIYLGDLESTFAGAARLLRPGGLLVFTVERFDAETGWTVGDSGRYLHSEGYLRELGDEAGFDAALLEAVSTRKERGEPVPGLAAVFRRR